MDPTATVTVTLDDDMDDATIITGDHQLNVYGPADHRRHAADGRRQLRRDAVPARSSPETGTLHFTGRKGGRTLATKDLTITDTTDRQGPGELHGGSAGDPAEPWSRPEQSDSQDDSRDRRSRRRQHHDGRPHPVWSATTAWTTPSTSDCPALQMTTNDIPPAAGQHHTAVHA